MQTATVGDLAARIRAAANLSGRRRTLFTFLVGAGFSVSAGMPSTSHLVRVMKRRLESPNLQQQSWRDLLDAAAVDASTDLGEPAALAYQRLLNEPALFPFPPHRQRFITDVVRWAADQHIEMSRESLLMAALLNAGSDSAPIDGGLSQWIAHTLYTTNFDEVLPQTFRYCGEAVAVVDHPHAHGRAQGDAFYPRIVYLHGSHLYYDLRNTEQELTAADRDRTGGVDLTGLFQRFRDTLRSTGLIILGYSGWRDRAMAAIRDALADRESLPFHLYWGAYPDVSSLSDEARSILDEHPGRAFLLEPGKTAAEVLALLSEQLDFKYEEIWSKWAERIGRLQEYASFVRGTSGPPSTSVGRAIAVESRPRPSAPNPAWHLEAGRLIEQANRAQREFDLQGMDKLRPAVEEHLAAADDEDRLTSEYRRLAVTRAGLFDLGPIDEAVEEWTRTVKSLREVTDDYALALALLGLSAARLRANQWDRAEAAALEAFELAQSAASEPVSVRSLLLLGRIALASDRLEDAQRFIDEGQQRAERARLDGDVATAKGLLVSLESRRGRLESARRIAAEQLEYRERNGPPTALAAALQDAGFVEQAAQRLSRAANYFSRAELIFREAGYVRGRAYVIARLG
ncbi:MAG TPA: SIR2 family protein, partial [Thermoanaerobaculia bacterium]